MNDVLAFNVKLKFRHLHLGHQEAKKSREKNILEFKNK